MFDQYAAQLIDRLPELPAIDRGECRRALSLAYYYLIRMRTKLWVNETERNDLRTALATLRRMSDALERICVFDSLNGVHLEPEVQQSCAFVAAESIALTNDIRQQQGTCIAGEHPLFDDVAYGAIEAGLLYLIAAYDVNAASVVREIDISPAREATTNPEVGMAANAQHLLGNVVRLCNGLITQVDRAIPYQDSTTHSIDYPNVVYDTKACCYAALSQAVVRYADWLHSEESDDGANAVVESLLAVRTGICGESAGIDMRWQSSFADIYHLASILTVAIKESSKRAVIHSVPPPGDDEEANASFSRYLRDRVEGGESGLGRPFLWPSALDYVQHCLPGPHTDCVVSMPTGSGKSFVAELAIANALARGWALYLVPTNALANQVRYDLKSAFRYYNDVEIRAFVGFDEYTSLSEEQVTQQTENARFVAVMTPEKLALALRLHPEAFSSCSLCVFDECHLIGDKNRGTLVDVSLAQLMEVAPAMRFLLMSAMVGNPEELANWLRQAQGQDAYVALVKWKPTRAMRGMTVVERNSLDLALPEAQGQADRLTGRFKNVRFPVSVAVIAGLSGPWTRDGAADYRMAGLPFSCEAMVTKGSREVTFPGWKNVASRALAELFARNGIPTICFILANKHEAFSLAAKTESILADGQEALLSRPVEAYLQISDAELGVSSFLRDILPKGIAVHTSAMLASEHFASERMFRARQSPLMFATGTLAQGLNLPAIAVVIAGTTIGNDRGEANDARARSTILNAFGRAGRPGFANQGIVILTSDKPYSARSGLQIDASLALNRYAVLGEPDAAVSVGSPIEHFFDRLSSEDDIFSDQATREDLELTTLLVESQRQSRAVEIARRTYAAYRKRDELGVETYARLETRLEAISASFLSQEGVPDWLNAAAMLAGVDFLRVLSMWRVIQSTDLSGTDRPSPVDWLAAFLHTMSRLPPASVQRYFAEESVRTPSPRTQLRDLALVQRGSGSWEPSAEWLQAWEDIGRIVLSYIRGDTFSDVAQMVGSGITVTNQRHAQAAIPGVFKFISEVIDPLSIDAGCFLVILESMVKHGSLEWEDVPEALKALPLCIRNGCDSLSSLAWFRFGYRQRICAHVLASVFPVPDTLDTDSGRAEWVRTQRREWLDAERDTDAQLHALLPAIRTIMMEQQHHW